LSGDGRFHLILFPIEIARPPLRSIQIHSAVPVAK